MNFASHMQAVSRTEPDNFIQSVNHPERRAVLWPILALVVKPGWRGRASLAPWQYQRHVQEHWWRRWPGVHGDEPSARTKIAVGLRALNKPDSVQTTLFNTGRYYTA